MINKLSLEEIKRLKRGIRISLSPLKPQGPNINPIVFLVEDISDKVILKNKFDVLEIPLEEISETGIITLNKSFRGRTQFYIIKTAMPNKFILKVKNSEKLQSEIIEAIEVAKVKGFSDTGEYRVTYTDGVIWVEDHKFSETTKIIERGSDLKMFSESSTYAEKLNL